MDEVQVMIKESVYNRLRAIADRNDVPASDLIESLLNQAADQLGARGSQPKKPATRQRIPDSAFAV